MRAFHSKLRLRAGHGKRTPNSDTLQRGEKGTDAGLIGLARYPVGAVLLLCLLGVLAGGCGGEQEQGSDAAAEQPKQDAPMQEEKAPPREEPELFSEQQLEMLSTRALRGGSNPIHAEVRDGHARRVKQLLDAGFRADEQSLAVAASDGNADIVRLLLEGGAAPTGSLYAAVNGGHAEVVGLLLDAGAPADLTVRDRRTRVASALLEIAARRGHVEVVRRLLDAGAPVDIRPYSQETPLHSAARYGRAQIVRLLLERGADVNAKGRQTALHAAAIHGDAEVVRLLLEAGASPDILVTYGDETPLFFSAANGHEEVVRLILETGVSVDFPDGYATNPMHAAVRARDADIVRQLLDAGAAVHSRNNEGHYPIVLAASEGSAEITELLLTAGAPADLSALLTAADLGHADVARALMEAGASVLELDTRRNTMLHHAARAGSPEVVELFLSAGAPVDARNNSGGTPLSLAVEAAAYATSDFDERDADEVAERDRRLEVVKLLIKAGAPVNGWYIRLYDQETLLHIAARSSAMSLFVGALLEGGAAPNVQDEDGDTPLHMAAHDAYGPDSLETVRLLLEAGASAQVKNRKGQTPLDLAAGQLEKWRLIKDWESG